MLKTEGRRPVRLRDVYISKFVVMAVFLYCQEEHQRFGVTFQVFKLGKVDSKAFWTKDTAAFLATDLFKF
jgi:hypothetical protein